MKILTGELELHVTADIAYAVQAYYEATGDDAFMDEKGYRLIIPAHRRDCYVLGILHTVG